MSDVIKVEDKDAKEFKNEYKQIYYKHLTAVKMASERMKRVVC